MDVEHRLARIGVAVEYHSIASSGVAVLVGQRGASPDQLANEPVIVRTKVVQRGNVSARHDEDVHGRLRVDVPESYDPIVLVDDGAGDLPRDDLAEETILHVQPTLL
jgi:hypothetical protein